MSDIKYYCWNCNKLKKFEDFYKNKNKKNGISSECKDCSKKINKKRYYNKHKNKNFDLIFRYKHYINDAKRRNKYFNLTLKDFEKITSSKCKYCGKFSNENNYCGIDRLDNKIGYILENCVPCCDKCNRFKYIYSYKEMIEHAKDIVNFNQNKE